MKYYENITDFFDWKGVLLVICVVKSTRIGFIWQHLNLLNGMGKYLGIKLETSICFLKIPAVQAE